MITNELTNDIHQSYINNELIANAKVNTDPTVVKIHNSFIYHIKIMDYLSVQGSQIGKHYKTYYRLAKNLDNGDYSLTINNKINSGFLNNDALISSFILKEFKLLILEHQYNLIEKYLDTELLETIVSHIINLHVIQVKKIPKEVKVPIRESNTHMAFIEPTHVYDLAGNLFARPISHYSIETRYKYEYLVIPYRDGMQLITSEEFKQIKT